ncbi:hypothetical protein BC628DRAFT_464871 [Trametes gibbosa]|nr:hypothetical protein BC628DRAFT_464871 [Trametes gibbosa]
MNWAEVLQQLKVSPRCPCANFEESEIHRSPNCAAKDSQTPPTKSSVPKVLSRGDVHTYHNVHVEPQRCLFRQDCLTPYYWYLSPNHKGSCINKFCDVPSWKLCPVNSSLAGSPRIYMSQRRLPSTVHSRRPRDPANVYVFVLRRSPNMEPRLLYQGPFVLKVGRARRLCPPQRPTAHAALASTSLSPHECCGGESARWPGVTLILNLK